MAEKKIHTDRFVGYKFVAKIERGNVREQKSDVGDPQITPGK